MTGFRIRGLDHVSLTCGDLERSIWFYTELLGLPLRGRGDLEGEEIATIVGMPGVRIRWADVQLDLDQVVELLEYVDPKGEPLSQTTADPGGGHLAFEVDDVDAVHASLVAHGITVRSAPVAIDDDPAWQGVRVFYAVDPDGATLEFVERP